MTQDYREELASMLALGLLEGQEKEDALLLLQTDADFARTFHSFQEATADLFPLLPLQAPPKELREQLLRRVKSSVIVEPDRFEESGGNSNWTSWYAWSAAALLAIGCVWLSLRLSDLETQRRDTLSELASTEVQLRATAEQLAKNAAELHQTNAEKQRLAEIVPTLEKELAGLRESNELAKLRIVALQSEVTEFQKASAVVVWNPDKQEGIIEMANLPPLPDTKDYQLWLIDPAYKTPVNGGIIGATGTAFRPSDPVKQADAFAVSIERKGGVPLAEGPVIFVGK